MFRTCISRITQAITFASADIHTSAVLQATKRTGARNKKRNLLKTGRRAKSAAKNRPSVILGTRANDEEKKWKNCALAKLLIDEDLLSSSNALESREFGIGKVDVPKQFGFGVDTAEQEILLNSLPMVTANMAQQGEVNSKGYKENLETQQNQVSRFAKVLDLRNANAKGISYVNKRRIIYAFSTPQNPYDTGRSEVQAALLTYKIRNLWKHLTASKSDGGNRRNLRALVHQRAGILRHLKGLSRARYEILLERLSLEPESVEGELTV